MRTLLLLTCLTVPAIGQSIEKTTQWRGFTREHVTVAGAKAWITKPKKPLEGNPWIWRARFPNFHADMDATLLGEGFHVAYIDVAGLFGSPTAIARGDAFYRFATKERGLAKRVTLEGVSRGGLFVYNWATKHPDLVACIYCDTPVCDFKSWPGGKGDGIGHQPSWKQCLAAYKFDEDKALAFRKNPIDHAAIIAKAKIPVMHIVSENDRVVPPKENTYVLQTRLQQAGYRMQLIRVPKGTEKSHGHHFTHPQPKRVVDFILKHGSR